MLQLNKASVSLGSSDGQQGSSSPIKLSTLVGIARRQFPLILMVFAGCFLVGLLYLLMTPSSYTSTATMLIDTKKVQLFQQQSVLGDAPVDSGTVQTEIEILKSQNISRAVIKNLHLADDPEFVPKGSGLISAAFRAVTKLFVSPETRSEAQLERQALQTFEGRRSINRVGLTYVMEIGFRSFDPNKSAQIANGIADAYINDQLEAKFQATRRASVWLQDRIKELRQQATAAERAVVEFRQANNIVNAGEGKLINEQQVSEVNSQLILANAATAEAKARLDRINLIMKQAIPDASVADALKSEVIIKLRQQYLDIAGREAIWSAKYGANHLATVSLRNQMQELRRNISDEMKKIAESYSSDYEIALARETAMRSSLDQSLKDSKTTSSAQIQLRDLESNSQSYRSMYDNFLQRYMQAVQQQSFPITEARLISPASRPLNRSQPSAMIALALTVIGGAVISFGAAALRETTDRVFRTTSQIEDQLQVNCLAMLPALNAPEVFVKSDQPVGPRQIAPSNDMLRYVVNAPFSQYTEALRSVKVAVDLGGVIGANRVIGITSTIPNEGKTTTASNFAQLIAHAGNRVLLVDSDLRNPSLSRTLAPKVDSGWIDVLAGRKTLDDVMWSDPLSGLQFLPVGGGTKLVHTNEILGSKKVKDFFDRIRESYDYVILDLAPLAPVVDTRTTTNFVDSYIYVLEWGRTRMDIVEHTLSDAKEVHERLLGVVMNKADMSVIGRYEHHRSQFYHNKYYSRYGYTA